MSCNKTVDNRNQLMAIFNDSIKHRMLIKQQSIHHLKNYKNYQKSKQKLPKYKTRLISHLQTDGLQHPNNNTSTQCALWTDRNTLQSINNDISVSKLNSNLSVRNLGRSSNSRPTRIDYLPQIRRQNHSKQVLCQIQQKRQQVVVDAANNIKIDQQTTTERDHRYLEDKIRQIELENKSIMQSLDLENRATISSIQKKQMFIKKSIETNGLDYQGVEGYKVCQEQCNKNVHWASEIVNGQKEWSILGNQDSIGVGLQTIQVVYNVIEIISIVRKGSNILCKSILLRPILFTSIQTGLLTRISMKGRQGFRKEFQDFLLKEGQGLNTSYFKRKQNDYENCEMFKLELLQYLALRNESIKQVKLIGKVKGRYYDPLSKVQCFQKLMEDGDVINRDARIIGIQTINSQEYMKSLRCLGESLKKDVRQRVNDELKTRDDQIYRDISKINHIQDQYVSRLFRNEQTGRLNEYIKNRLQMVECLKSKKYYDHDIYDKLDQAETKLGKFEVINDTARLDNYVQNNLAQSIYRNAEHLQ